MPAWVRNGVLMGADELVAELGGDPAVLRRETGLDGFPLHEPDFPIPGSIVVQFLERAASVCACESFGLLLSQKQDFSIFGPLWPLFRTASSVGEALRDLAEFFPVHTQGALVGMEKTSDGAFISYDLASGVAQSRRQVIELGIGFLTTQLRRLRSDWQPSEVLFRHGPPTRRYFHHRMFGQNVQFNADRNAIFVDHDMLSQPFGSGEASERSDLALKFGEARATLPGTFRTHAELVVRGLLPFVPCDLATAARMMRTSPRTLQRRLGAEQTSFDQIVDKVRADLAMSYLRDSDLTIAAVAEILQFSETSALSRAFRRWYGLAPTHIRRPDSGGPCDIQPI